MREVAVAEKPKVILVGGMDYNVPQDLKDAFEIVKHITQGSRYNTLPQAQYVFVLTQWANHNIVDNVKRESKAPVVWLPQGWSAMKEALQKRSLLPPDAPEGNSPVAPSTSSPAAPSTLGMTQAEIWKKFGDKMVEACRAVLTLGQKVTEAELLEALALAGPPPEDCKHFLPRLQMLGVVVPTKDNLWRLASSDTEAYEGEPESEDDAEAEVPSLSEKRKNAEPRGLKTDAEERLRLIPGNPALVTRLIAGLKEGPYHTKTSIYREMRRYKEFAGLTENQVRSAVERAIELKIVDDSHKTLRIAHQDDLKLTLIEKQEVTEMPPMSPPTQRLEGVMGLMTPTPPPTVVAVPDGLSTEDAEKKWRLVVERVHAARQRTGDVLQHCRIEWMNTNKVLVIFLPAALSSCQKFLESMENWGIISRTVQEQFTRDTVVRFMLDNGLRT